VPRSDRTISVRTLGYASLAVILGAITHVVWDAFTHANTAVAGAFPFLQAEVFELRGRPIHVYFVLQVLCSAMGLLALAIWAFRMRHAPPVESGGRESRSTLTDRARIGAALFVLIISAATALLSYASFADSSLERRLFELLIGGMTGWALAWCLVALFVGWWSRIATPARFHP
jgi:hypothetical protein